MNTVPLRRSPWPATRVAVAVLRRRVSGSSFASQPSFLPDEKRSRTPPSVMKMSPSMYIEVMLATSRAVASQPEAFVGKPLPSLAGG